MGGFTLQPYFSVLKRGVLERASISPHEQPQTESFEGLQHKNKSSGLGHPPRFFS